MRGLIASCIFGGIWGYISPRIGITTTDPVFYVIMILASVMITLISPKNNDF